MDVETLSWKEAQTCRNATDIKSEHRLSLFDKGKIIIFWLSCMLYGTYCDVNTPAAVLEDTQLAEMHADTKSDIKPHYDKSNGPLAFVP